MLDARRYIGVYSIIASGELETLLVSPLNKKSNASIAVNYSTKVSQCIEK